jgi:flavin reductase (DIM6/NTAB) family NADH-FMN oxidoreductase RutF
VRGKRSLALSRVYRLLEPGPVVLLTTAHGGRANVMPMSWLTMMEFEPPLLGCVVSDRNWSFGLLARSRQCGINVPTAELAKPMVDCGNVSGRRVDKFSAFGFTPVPASPVAAPLVAECYANLECVVADTRFVAKYGFFVLEVVKAWIDPARREPRTLHHRGRGVFAIDGRTIALPFRGK